MVLTTDVAALVAELRRTERERDELLARNTLLEQSEAHLAAQMRLASLAADVGVALTGTDDLRDTLQQCAQAVVDRLDAAFARVWTLNDAEQLLELRASAGLYTHLDGPHGRIPVGQFNIGLIAQDRKPHLTNHVVGDSRISDQQWARHEGMVSFAGFPLVVGTTVVGVLAMFARRPLADGEFEALAGVARTLSVGIARIRANDALRDSEAGHRQRADELARLAEALARSNKELDAFAYAASHDLRAPLRGIANLAQWIEEDMQSSLSEGTREMLALLRSRMHRMEALIEGILQYSRAGRIHERPARVDVQQLLREIIDLLALDRWTIAVDPNMPALFTGRLPLRQVFQNLIGNAVKHAGPHARVQVGARDAGEFWEFSVRDNGPGIPLEFQDRIWGIFQTLESRDTVEGAGIGLALVKKLVDTHGGRVAVESAPGAGARFTFTWPKGAEAEV